MLVRTFRYPIHPNKSQEATLREWLGFCCLLYNSALQERRDAWKKQRKNISWYDQKKSLTEIRKDLDYARTPAWTGQQVLAKLDNAFKAFFRRIKSGEDPGYPRFKSSKRYNSFDFLPNPGLTSRDASRVFISNLGLVKANIYRPLQGIPKKATVKLDATNKWWISISCDLGEPPKKVPVLKSTGIDLGLTHFAVLADGSQVQNPKFFRQSEELLASRQRSLASKKHLSKNRNKARILVAKTHKKIQNQRLDFFRKLASALFSQYDLVAYEDLKGMTSGRLAKSVHDASWRTFTGILACKAESASKHAIPVNPRNTSQRCSGCGSLPAIKKDLSVRIHSCPDCGLVLDRDHNAAINIHELGLSSLSGKPGEKPLGTLETNSAISSPTRALGKLSSSKVVHPRPLRV